ncbi:MAG TPA: hypothetical protein VI583_08205 [Cyclobacteriaceae bacterium]|nr:hypothetical protein [Cyclobacteriaceae bacterium]
MAESDINFQYIQNYSKRFAEAISEGFFRDKTNITGKDVLDITGIRQVNLLVIRNIYITWQNEIETVKSPYFNYRAPDVIEAQLRYGNALSNNILIGRKDFEPLLAKGTEQSLLLILSPYEFFISLFNSYKKEFISIDDLKKDRKYLKVNTKLYDSFLRRMDEQQTGSGAPGSIIGIFNQVCEKSNESPDDPDQFISVFSKVTPFDMKMAYREREAASPGPEKARTAHEVISAVISADKKTLLDEYQDNRATTIADFLQRKTIESIRKSITINQKFMFVRELFNENEESFTKTINELDGIDNFRDAEKYLDDHFFRNNNWPKESAAVNEFIEVLQKKFS